MKQGAIIFRLVTSEQQLAELAPAWRGLLADSAQAAPMLDPCWVVTWWKHYGRGRTLACGVFEAEGQLVGLAPFCLRSHWYKRILRYRRLEFLGSAANEPDALCSEYLDLIVRRGREDAVAAECARALLAGAFGAWDECVLEAMATSAVGNSVMQQLGQLGSGLETGPVETAPYVRLPANWDAYLDLLSSKQRRYLKTSLRHFESWAAPSGYEVHRAHDAASLRVGMTILARLHAERWRQDDEAGAFTAPRFSAFHSEYAEAALASGQIELVWVTVAGEPIMAHYNLIGRDTVYFYQSGRKVGLPNSIRPGIVMHILVLQDAMAKGYREYDFLGGDSTYKRLLATDARPLANRRVARPSASERVLQSAKRALSSLRQVRTQLWPGARSHDVLTRRLRRAQAPRATQPELSPPAPAPHAPRNK